MSLPKLNAPIYDLTIPSTGNPIRVRPILVREEKLLLMALQSNDDSDIIQTTKDVIRSCIIDEDIDIDKLPFYDVDYLFIALRAKSVGNNVDIKFTCKNIVDEEICGATFPAKIDVSNVRVKKPPVNNTIGLDGGISIKMKVPSYSALRSIDGIEGIDKNVQIAAACVEFIAEGDKIHNHKDIPYQELIHFIESLTHEQFSQMLEFIDNFPSFVVESTATCTKCGFNHHLEYTDFQSFFA
jgi:hypothetical protein